MAIIYDLSHPIVSRESILSEQLALATQERNAYMEAADRACFQRDLAIQYVAILRDAVEFAKDTTDRGAVADMMDTALASTWLDVKQQDETTIQLKR